MNYYFNNNKFFITYKLEILLENSSFIIADLENVSNIVHLYFSLALHLAISLKGSIQLANKKVAFKG